MMTWICIYNVLFRFSHIEDYSDQDCDNKKLDNMVAQNSPGKPGKWRNLLFTGVCWTEVFVLRRKVLDKQGGQRIVSHICHIYMFIKYSVACILDNLCIYHDMVLGISCILPHMHINHCSNLPVVY